MDTTAFWHLIETAKAESKGNCDQQAQLLQQYLTLLPPEEIQSFDRILGQITCEAYDDDLWAAAYIINGGCSDDGFAYFRGWLITQGETVFRNALRDPDSLTELVNPDEAPDGYECEELLYVAMKAYEARTGQEMPLEESASLEPTEEPLAEDSIEKEEIWIEGDLSEQYARKHFPKLCAKFRW